MENSIQEQKQNRGAGVLDKESIRLSTTGSPSIMGDAMGEVIGVRVSWLCTQLRMWMLPLRNCY